MRPLALAAVLAALVFTPTAAAWTWPADGPVLQPFLFDPAHPYAGGQHRGIDVGGDSGADVRAPADEWIKKVEARRSALEASHRVVADALGALGKSSP